MRIAGVILAGGLSRRMGGGDKALLPLAGRPLLAHVIERLAPQVETLILNANGDPARFAAFAAPLPPACGGEGLGVGGEVQEQPAHGPESATFHTGLARGNAPHPDPPRRKRGEGEHPGLPIVPDLDQNLSGPLAGILAGLTYVRKRLSGIDAVVSVPADTPFIPGDLVARLVAAREGADIVMATSAGRDHPTVALWRVSLLEPLAQALARDERRVLSFIQAYRHARVNWPAEPVDLFGNINTPEELAAAEKVAPPL